ncbi:hypothetical protein QVA66_11430 [Staphylococcus chromogenes]|nr:hypothetical protein [Staphylococcus chromogenes]
MKKSLAMVLLWVIAFSASAISFFASVIANGEYYRRHEHDPGALAHYTPEWIIQWHYVSLICAVICLIGLLISLWREIHV